MKDIQSHKMLPSPAGSQACRRYECDSEHYLVTRAVQLTVDYWRANNDGSLCLGLISHMHHMSLCVCSSKDTWPSNLASAAQKGKAAASCHTIHSRALLEQLDPSAVF